MLTELSRREKEANIKPDPDIDVYMKVQFILFKSNPVFVLEVTKVAQSYCVLLCKQAISVEGQESVVTDYILKVSKNILHQKK